LFTGISESPAREERKLKGRDGGFRCETCGPEESMSQRSPLFNIKRGNTEGARFAEMQLQSAEKKTVLNCEKKEKKRGEFRVGKGTKILGGRSILWGKRKRYQKKRGRREFTSETSPLEGPNHSYGKKGLIRPKKNGGGERGTDCRGWGWRIPKP